jgi:hypothetical protein
MRRTRWAIVGLGALAVVSAVKRRRRRIYIEEVSSGSRPIEGVGTSTAGFVGPAPPSPEQKGCDAEQAFDDVTPSQEFSWEEVAPERDDDGSGVVDDE